MRKDGDLPGRTVPPTDRPVSEPVRVEIARRIDGGPVHPDLVRVPDLVVGIGDDLVLPALRRRVEAEQAILPGARRPADLRHPDDPLPIDDDLVHARPRIRQDVVLLLAGARIESDEAIGIPAVHEPRIALGVELHSVGNAGSGPAELPLRFRGRALGHRVGWQVVLDELRLPERGFVEGNVGIRPHRPRRAVRPEVRDQVLEQVLPVLEPEAEVRGGGREDAFRRADPLPLEETPAHHQIEGRLPPCRVAGAPRREVLPMAHHADLFQDAPSGARRVDLVVALQGQIARRGIHRTGKAVRPVGIAQRHRDVRTVTGADGQLLHVRDEPGRLNADLVAPRQEPDGPEPTGGGVDHVQDPPVGVAGIDARRGEGPGRFHRAGQARRTRKGPGPLGTLRGPDAPPREESGDKGRDGERDDCVARAIIRRPR